jgi:hypothetical protein
MQLLTTKEAATQPRIDRKGLAELGIPYVLLGKRRRLYRQEDLDAFVESKVRYAHPLPTYERRRSATPYRVSIGPTRYPTWEEAKAIAEAQIRKPENRLHQLPKNGTTTHREADKRRKGHTPPKGA